MPPPIAPGFFRLYPFAEPPLPAGRYTLTGDVAGLPGDVEPLNVTVDVVAPRYAMPPDQILSTFPPAGTRGAFTSRLPQVVLRRRTLPWERSKDLVPGGIPTPWLALVLIAEGEGELRSDVPVEQCVSPGVALDAERDVAKAAYLEVPERVVRAVFPTEEDLKLLTHVREVDISDTELAMGDDDGWMAVVLGNRLPQANTRYLACLINLEGQYHELPTVPDAELELAYDRLTVVADLRIAAAETFGAAAGLDQAVMGLAGAQALGAASLPLDGGPLGAAAGAAASPALRAASGKAAPTGAGWATTAGSATGIKGTSAAAAADGNLKAAGAKMALADGFAFPAALLLERTLRFPVLAYWSFSCEERGDFQYLAEHVTSRLLGYVPDPTRPETPDGDEPAGPVSPPGARPEPSQQRPLPLVAETGHLVLSAVTRRGDAAEAWFRGPLAPAPVERADTRPDEDDPRPPLAHHADQLRRVVPDGREDLGYAAAFEIGRLLALSQPGIVAALGQWRQEAYGAARVRSAAADAIADAPDGLRELAVRPDHLTDDSAERLRAGGAGRRAARALVELLGAQNEPIAPPRPLADPGAAAADLKRLMPEGRDTALLGGLGLARSLGQTELKDPAAVAATLAQTPVLVAGKRDLKADLTALRQALEFEAGRLADATGGGRTPGNVVVGPGPLGGGDENE